MSPNRAAPRRGTVQVPVKTLVTVVAIVAALAFIPLLISLQSGESNAAPDPTGMVGAPPVVDARTSAGQAGAGSAGPLTETDRKLLVAVRQAGLWEIPAGRLAQTHASSEAVKRAGLHLIDGHSRLDQLVREDARILGVEIPNEPTPEQQGWLKQLEGAKGAEFDRLFANLLRASHGKIFTTIAQVRGATQNDIIRRHAREANQTVLDHIEVLEDTGLVEPETFEEVERAVMPQQR